MSISKQILGMNARNFLYIARYNKPSAKRRADDKLLTKRRLIENDIATSRLIHTFISRKSLRNFSWDLPRDGFVLKPARGYGGEGILVFKTWENGEGTTISGETFDLKQIQAHILDIFDGIYSLQQLPDRAYIEEKVIPHPFFKKLAPTGLPDIRIIVFNKVPVMAMLRLPNEESHGKANLHQGAIGIGIGMRTGITNHATYKGSDIKFIPGTKIKASGLKISGWNELLLLAARAQDVSGLGYTGIDIVIDRKKGPLVLEMNARPGLEIQNANFASLRERLERVENLDVSSPQRGVEIAKSIFVESFAEKVQETQKVLSVIEPITILGSNGHEREYQAKLDTGAYRTSIDKSIAREFNLQILEDEKIHVSSASGAGTRPAVRFTFRLGGKKITTVASVADRSRLQFPLIIGRRDLAGFYVNPLLAADKKGAGFLSNDDEFGYEDTEE